MAKTLKEKLVFVDDLEIRVIYKRIRTTRLHVKPPDGRIEISTPPGTSDSEIATFVRRKRAWIDDVRRKQAASPMSLAESATPEQVKQWRAVVEECTPALVAAWEPILGVKAKTLAYRNMKSRWGSCQPATGRICINVRLALYPPECLEYVVVHELCHLLVRGHGPDFHKLMTSVMPDWRQRKAKLR